MFTKNSFNGKADPVADSIKAIAEADYALKLEALKGDQTKLDKNKNNKLDADDFKILRGNKKVNEADEKPRSAGSVFDKDVAKSFQKKKPGESTGHESKKTSTGTEYTKKAPKPEETNEDFNSFKAKLKAGVKAGAKKVARVMGGPDDEGHIKDLQRKAGVAQTGKKPEVKEEVEFNLEEIDPALVEEFMQTEEFEQLDELSKNTIKSYIKKKMDKVYKTDAPPSMKHVKKTMSNLQRAHDRNTGAKPTSEEVEEISELKKSTLASYAKKATDDVSYHSFTAGTQKASDPERLKSDKKAMSRQAGVNKAVDRLAKEEVEELSELSKETLKSYQDKAMKTPPSKNSNWVSRISGVARSAEKLKKEEVEQVEERSLTPAETAEMEKNVKGMKKNMAGFKARYGSRAKEVMYATATKQAKD